MSTIIVIEFHAKTKSFSVNDHLFFMNNKFNELKNLVIA
jgi:hypothetical protein